MDKIELAVADETQVDTENKSFELSLLELDMVGGGGSIAVNT